MTVIRSASRGQAGMTLVEVIIVMFIIAVVFVSFAYFMADVLFGRTRTIATLDVQENARLGMDRMITEIRDAKEVDTTSSSFAVNLASSANANKLLKLTMTSSTLSPTEFSVRDGVLHIRQGPSATATPLTASSTRVTELYFHNYPSMNARNVGVEFTVTYRDSVLGLGNASTSLRGSATLRNR